jgi:hypothetical protein
VLRDNPTSAASAIVVARGVRMMARNNLASILSNHCDLGISVNSQSRAPPDLCMMHKFLPHYCTAEALFAALEGTMHASGPLHCKNCPH